MSTNKLVSHTASASDAPAQPGWFREPRRVKPGRLIRGPLIPGIPNFDYKPRPGKDSNEHRHRIKNYHREWEKRFREAKKRGDSDSAQTFAKEMYRCDQERIKLLAEEHRLASEYSRLETEWVGGGVSTSRFALEDLARWEGELDKARKETEGSAEVKFLRKLKVDLGDLGVGQANHLHL